MSYSPRHPGRYARELLAFVAPELASSVVPQFASGGSRQVVGDAVVARSMPAGEGRALVTVAPTVVGGSASTRYRGDPVAAGDTPQLDSAAGRDVLANPRIALTAIQRSDLRSGQIDPRVIATMAWIARHHSIVIMALKSDHSRYTVDGNVSNHAAGRAMDIGAVDGDVCRGIGTGRCADLVRELAAVKGSLRSTELIYCWDPDGPGDQRGFARADHCDHMHVGWDG